MSFDSAFESPSHPRKRQCRRPDDPNDSAVDNASGSEEPDVTATSTAFSDRLGSEVVSIYVGPSKQLFTVHKNLLTSCATFFSKLFSGPFLEASTSSATFPEDPAPAWGLLVQWLYTGRLAPLIQTSHRDALEAAALDKRIQLYCLAETYDITGLLDSTIDTIAATFRVRTRTPDLASFRYVYGHTSETSPLRALMARWFYHLLITKDDVHVRPTRYSTEAMYSLATETPDLLHDLFELMRGQQSLVPKHIMDPSDVHGCTYHAHTARGESVCTRTGGGMSAEAAKLLKLMVDTFPNSRKRFSVESLARRLSLDRKATLALVDELVELKKVIWAHSGSETFLQCL